MCLILLALDAHPKYRLVFASNRDEFMDRPAAPASWWPEASNVLAGRDLRAGGTWMGVARSEAGLRWAAVTNVRDLERVREGARSRGELVGGFLTGSESAADAAARAQASGAQYNPFNLLTGDSRETWYASSHTQSPIVPAPGIHGMSNATLDTPWPKVVAGVAAFERAMTADEVDEDALFDILGDRTPADDAHLPHTGVGRAWERALSSRFIVAEGYGSRASTILLLDRTGGGRFVERTFGEGGVFEGEVAYDL